MNYGVRIDFLKASVDPQDIAAGPFTPARHYNGLENVPNWKDVDPRFGVAYDLFGNGDPAGQLDPRLDCNLANPLLNGTCGPLAVPTFGTQVAPTTTYDPAIVQARGARP